jgi:hypothetical protein
VGKLKSDRISLVSSDMHFTQPCSSDFSDVYGPSELEKQ